ncbi:MAG TPA: porphobilinogen synthase [Candidatus Dormibacteraeota bacterium]|jgi:porphobilinogen synthase|nr:porphobilinogen synthase [Candidatus Dormibacteraeota bacterium]
MSFPESRPRRLRRTPLLRKALAETRLRPEDLVLPLFVADGIEAPRPIDSLPGHFHHTDQSVLEECAEAVSLGIPMVLLFGLPADKDVQGSGAWDSNGAVQRASRNIKERFGDDLLVVTDLCLCEYTTHGHCGLLKGEAVDNDGTLEAYAQVAISQAAAGADIVAPSGMMDGQVAAIRTALDDTGHDETAILAYSAKMASAFYGPFRDAAGSTPAFGDRRGYQMPGANSREALRETWLDIDEGADMVMVKPAGPYLDVISRVADEVPVPVAAYQVSGEFGMLHAAIEKGWLERDPAILESLVSIRRAGADLVISYLAKEAVHIITGTSAKPPQ